MVSLIDSPNKDKNRTGTPIYMAPEVIQKGTGEHKYSFPADVYSLAITLWEISRREFVFKKLFEHLFIFRRPYANSTESTYELVCTVLKGSRPLPPKRSVFQKFLGREQPQSGNYAVTEEIDELIRRYSAIYYKSCRDYENRGWSHDPLSRPSVAEFLEFAKDRIPEVVSYKSV